MDARIKVSIDSWDDPAFRSAFERVYKRVAAEGLAPDTPDAALRAQHLLVEAGYPGARVELERSVDEALARVAHWSVFRDAPAPAPR
jgi:hypothetical protein